MSAAVTHMGTTNPDVGSVNPDYREAMWDLYWHVFYGTPRKETLRKMISRGLTARQAIEEMRSVEREPSE
jgi:hypothetical protein